MTDTALATPGNLAAHWEDAAGVDQTVQQTSLAYASAVLRNSTYQLDARITSGEVDPLLVRGIVCEMVKRHLSDPVTSEQMEDTTFTLSVKWMESGIYPTQRELDQLAPAKTGRSRIHMARSRPGLLGQFR